MNTPKLNMMGANRAVNSLSFMLGSLFSDGLNTVEQAHFVDNRDFFE